MKLTDEEKAKVRNGFMVFNCLMAIVILYTFMTLPESSSCTYSHFSQDTQQVDYSIVGNCSALELLTAPSKMLNITSTIQSGCIDCPKCETPTCPSPTCPSCPACAECPKLVDMAEAHEGIVKQDGLLTLSPLIQKKLLNMMPGANGNAAISHGFNMAKTECLDLVGLKKRFNGQPVDTVNSGVDYYTTIVSNKTITDDMYCFTRHGSGFYLNRTPDYSGDIMWSWNDSQCMSSVMWVYKP